MPFTKVYNGAGTGATEGDYGDSRNWDLISLRTAAFAWTASGSGTNEYYLRTAGGANPGFVASPPTTNGVYINGAAATKATLGSLAAGTWGYGDNDTLGYSTVYVRLSAGGDPDAQSADHVQFRQIPQATEHVRIPASAVSITSNLDQSAVAIGDFIRERGHEGEIGLDATVLLPPTYLRIDPDRFEHHGNGKAWIDIGTAAISPQIYGTVGPADGERGLYLRGTAIATLNVMDGSVGLAVLGGELSTATTVRVTGQASLWIGNGVTLTNGQQWDGTLVLRCGSTALIQYGGEMTTEENGTHTALTQYGGTHIWRSTGNYTTHNLHGGTFDEMQSGATRTCGTRTIYRGASNVRRNKESVTVTTEVTQESLSISYSF